MCVQDQDSVVSCLGYRRAGLAPWTHPFDVGYLTLVMHNICNAMKSSLTAKKLVVISAAGVADSSENTPWWFNWMASVSFLRNIFPLLAEMELVALESGLDVCVIRPPILYDGNASTTNKVELTKHMSSSQARISRADVANWISRAICTEGKFAQSQGFLCVIPAERTDNVGV